MVFFAGFFFGRGVAFGFSRDVNRLRFLQDALAQRIAQMEAASNG